MEEKNNCKNKAEIAVPWAGKILRCCEQHANGLVILGNVMGSPVQPMRLPKNTNNCEMKNDL